MSNFMDIETITCAFCQGAANQRCTGCHITFYCSKEHQKQHWKKHKTNCCAYKVCASSTLGRYVIATRDLKPGELVLSECPTVMAPMAFTIPICLSCYKSVDGSKRCPKCGWALCSEGCMDSASHVPECSFTQARGKPIPADVAHSKRPHPLYEIVALLRCLYHKQSNQPLYDKLLQLESHTQERLRSGRLEKDKVLLKMVRQFFKIDVEAYGDHEILDLLGILFVNTHEVPVTAVPVQALYLNGSLIEHNCTSNASKHFDKNGTLQIRAAIHIRKGDHIAIMYSDPMWGTVNRQQHLFETKFFQCRCSRCLDPFELGTNFSSLRCPNCPAQSQGFLVAQDPMNSLAPWHCAQCGNQEPADYVNAVIRSIGEELVQLEKDNPEACLMFIKKHSQNLHRNHFYLMDVKLALSQMIGKTSSMSVSSSAGEGASNQPTGAGEPSKISPDLNEKDLIIKQKLCMELIEIANTISPGISRLRGVILYELQATLSSYARKKFTKGEITPEHLKNIMQEVRNYLKECIQIFSYEPTCIQEGRLAAVARLDLIEVDTYVDSLEPNPKSSRNMATTSTPSALPAPSNHSPTTNNNHNNSNHSSHNNNNFGQSKPSL
ncbi:SET domain-containing protein SmydA-8-like isoform X1 [Tigriopus californicus]|nr:SET domain-containing protein SmydA-8-like isoform X1 [Tigriopus californicus]